MINFKRKKIGIMGVGVVGEALAGVLPSVFLYDKYKNIGSLDEINRTDVIFICVPTPHLKKTGFDLSYIEDAFSVLEGRKIVVIKSTVLPGTTEKMQKKYPQHKVLFNPEFLRQKTAKEDMQNPDRQIVGYAKRSKPIAKEILKILPKAPYEYVVPSIEAEMTKYFANSFLATKVIFANQIYDLCQKLGADYDSVKEMTGSDPRIGHSHLNVLFDGYRGYGGSCFPKDVSSLIQLADGRGVDLRLLKLVRGINKSLLKNNKNRTEIC